MEALEACIVCQDELGVGVFDDVAFSFFGKFRIDLSAMRYRTDDGGKCVLAPKHNIPPT